MAKANRATIAAERILRASGASVPVDIERIARAHSLEVIYRPMEETVSGMLVIKEKRAIACINARHHPHRRRFTLAHELGHYLLHGERVRVFIDASPIFFRDERASCGTDQREVEANRFAASLLMPEAALREMVGAGPFDLFDDRAMQRLAAQFGVSPQAMAIRLAALGLGAL
ncbi:MAG: ImmA/IrrE family metallo-endopeptidase [Pyrinomonas sp.]|uniref:ImmA/IrrE family metallo-endopeptidase n=1 Tax=Pyrinomonas sp. TaxID=2080306 RepID=UPI003322DE8F